MGLYIKCGIFNKFYLYIFLTIIFYILYKSVYGYTYSEIFEEFNIIRIFNSDIQKVLPNHVLIHSFFNYCGTFILSFLMYIYEIMVTRKLKKSDLDYYPHYVSRKNRIVLVHIKTDYYFNITKIFFNCLFITFLWILEENLILLFKVILRHLDFWFFELLIIAYFIKKKFKIEMYKHQKLSIVLNIIPSILKIFTIILSCQNNDKNILYVNTHFLLILDGILIFIVLITIRSYVNTNMKWFMDLKYISPNKLLMVYGGLGGIIFLIICFFISFIKCDHNQDIKINNFICNVTDNKTGNFYYDNYIIYSDNFTKDWISEIIVIIFGIITFFGHKYCYLSVIQLLTPVHLIFSIPIYYFLEKIVLIFYNICSQDNFSIKMDYKGIKFRLDISGDIISFFAFLIYLEIIEFNFCNFNYNTKKNITRRSCLESPKNITFNENNDIPININEEDINDNQTSDDGYSWHSSYIINNSIIGINNQ